MSETEPQSEPAHPVRHPEFYFTDDAADTIFLIQGTLYKVHRFQLIRASEGLRGIFDIPSGEAGEGQSDEKPICPPEQSVWKEAFEPLLELIYFGMFSSRNVLLNALNPSWEVQNPPPGSPLLGTKIYHLLKFSILWQCDNIVTEILQSGAYLDPVFQLEFALDRGFDARMKDWVKPAFEKLISRERSLSPDEITRLGPLRSAIVCEHRERRIDRLGNGRGSDLNRWLYSNDRSYGVAELR